MKYDLSSTKEREKADLLTVVAYGAHDIALEAVRNILEGKGILNFRLYEFFASPPIPKGKSPEGENLMKFRENRKFKKNKFL